MITVQRENGDVMFFNEKEHVSCAYYKEERKFMAIPTEPTAHIGIVRGKTLVDDVVYVAYTNEAQPTNFVVHADERPRQSADYDNDRLVDKLFREMQRLERLEKEEKRKQDPYGRVQKSGHAVRFLNAVKAADIETVGQLLALGRRGAEDIRNSGRKCVDLAAKALENVYGIKDW